MPLFGGPKVDKLKSRRDVPELAKVLRYQSDWKVRQSAAEALGELGDASAIGPLVYALGYDDKEHVRWSAAQALGRIRDVKALEPLLEAATRDPTISVRSASAEAIAQIGEPAVKPLIAVLPRSTAAALDSRPARRQAGRDASHRGSPEAIGYCRSRRARG